jgi:transposase
MSANLVYLGVDVAKATLDCHFLQASFRVPNTPAGFAQVRHRLAGVAGGALAHVVCEATGGYQNAFVADLQAHGWRVSVVNPRQVRDLARSRGLLAKTDRLDARILAEYGRVNAPAPTPARAAHLQRLERLLAQRDHLVAQRATERTRRHQIEDPWLQRQTARVLAFYDRELAKLEAQLLALRDAAPALKAQADHLDQMAGLDWRGALGLLGYLPELGTLSRRAVAKLAGLAPFNRDSGQTRGQRHIGGGRAPVRRLLYLASLTAIRKNQILKTFYHKLRTAGKPPKVALTAVARKLLILLNSSLQNPNIQLAS